MDRLIYLVDVGREGDHAAPGHARQQPRQRLDDRLSRRAGGVSRVPVEGSGASTRVYALESTPGYDASPGQVAATGRNLDVAMKGSAWLAVQALDGTEAYTRGSARSTSIADGNLITTSGLTVLGDGGPIQVPPNDRAEHRQPTARSARPTRDGRSTAIGKLKLVTPEAPLTRGADGLFRGADGDLSADATARGPGRRARGLERQRGRDDGRR